MNFIEGRAEANGAGPVFAAEGIHIPLPAGVAARPGQNLTCGVRPADLVLSDGGDIEGTLVLAEKTGADLNLHLSVGGRDFVATAPRDARVTQGAPVKLAISPAKIHLFDPDSGRRL
jgi:multiple sugar transport system ATP-binding protein